MAQKKVILKDGADELLPKTSASMVFTESGQTVENALKNAGTGGGGTGGGIDEEQLAQYLQQHKYITQTELDEANYLKPTSAITGYAKASNYTALDPTDTLNEALGKLEAGIGSGAGGGDDVYYLPGDIFILDSNKTKDEIVSAFGGVDKIREFAEAVILQNKIVYIRVTGQSLYVCNGGNVPVSVSFWGFGATELSISFVGHEYKKGITPVLKKINLIATFSQYEGGTNSVSNASVKIIYEEGYALKPEIYLLSTNSTSDEISTAIGGEAGLKGIIQAVKDGNRLVIRGTTESFSNYTINQDLICSMYDISDNGDMMIVMVGYGLYIFGGKGNSLVINYTKSSNLFSLGIS